MAVKKAEKKETLLEAVDGVIEAKANLDELKAAQEKTAEARAEDSAKVGQADLEKSQADYNAVCDAYIELSVKLGPKGKVTKLKAVIPNAAGFLPPSRQDPQLIINSLMPALKQYGRIEFK